MSELRRRRVWIVLALSGFVAGGIYVAMSGDDPVPEEAVRPTERTRTENIVTPTPRDRPEEPHAAGTPAPSIPAIPAMPAISEAHDRVYDPQRAAMRRGFRITADDAGAALPFEPLERSAVITSVTGTLPFGSDAACTARVLPARSGRFNCLVRVICAGRIVYPNQAQTAGYVRCDLDGDGRPIRIADSGHSALDGDPMVHFDVASRELVVEDRGDGVQPFRLALQVQ